MRNFFFSTARYFSIVILLLLTAMSYHPSFTSFVTDGEGVNPLSRYIYLMTVVTFILNLDFKAIIREKVIKIYFLGISSIFITGLLVYAVTNTSDYIEETRDCLMALIFFIIGYCSRFSQKQLLFLLMAYGIMVMYCTLMQITVNLGGFSISAMYMQYGKNTLGVMTSTSCIALFCYGISDKRISIKTITIGLALILFAFTVTIRARAAFLTTFIIIVYISVIGLKQIKRGPEKLLGIILGILACLLVFSIFSSTVSLVLSYIYDSFTLNQGTDLTSDRLSRNKVALNIILDYPLFGNLEANLSYGTVHNYFLRVASSYGLLCCIPLVVLYLYLFILCLKNTLRARISISSLGFVTFLIPLIISLEEPTFPYGPGTGIVLSFIMLGLSIRNKYYQYES